MTRLLLEVRDDRGLTIRLYGQRNDDVNTVELPWPIHSSVHLSLAFPLVLPPYYTSLAR